MNRAALIAGIALGGVLVTPAFSAGDTWRFCNGDPLPPDSGVKRLTVLGRDIPDYSAPIADIAAASPHPVQYMQHATVPTGGLVGLGGSVYVVRKITLGPPLKPPDAQGSQGVTVREVVITGTPHDCMTLERDDRYAFLEGEKNLYLSGQGYLGFELQDVKDEYDLTGLQLAKVIKTPSGRTVAYVSWQTSRVANKSRTAPAPAPVESAVLSKGDTLNLPRVGVFRVAAVLRAYRERPDLLVLTYLRPSA